MEDKNTKQRIQDDFQREMDKIYYACKDECEITVEPITKMEILAVEALQRILDKYL
jgi:phage/plasmid-associated DNA primase